jgi:small subunit ribosomal protein S2
MATAKKPAAKAAKPKTEAKPTVKPVVKAEATTEAKPAAVKAETKPAAPEIKVPATKVKLPEVKELLRAGMQFGHESKRWNPKMKPFIFGKKNDIHIIDISKSMPLLQVAGDFLVKAIQQGPVLMLGTKRQAAEIINEAAAEAGLHFITNRWAGGLLTNFAQIKRSIDRLNDLERQFEEGIVGRTKYEIAIMKKDWERLHRLYGGIKKLEKRPVAVIIVDPNFEAGAVRECNYLDIPMVAMVDTNSDPTIIDYPIPANDDAINSIKLVLNYLVQRISEIDSAHKVKHQFKDYTKAEIAIKKAETKSSTAAELVEQTKSSAPSLPTPNRQQPKPAKSKSTKAEKAKAAADQSGILGKYQEQRAQETKQKTKTAKK